MEPRSFKKELLSKRLRRLRLKRGQSVSEIARQLNVAVSTYREWEYGSQIKGEPYAQLAALFNVSLSELLLGDESKNLSLSERLSHVVELIEEIKQQL